MSEADRLWAEAMEALAADLDSIPRGMLMPDGIAWLNVCAGFARMKPRPAGWGEGGKGHE